MIVLGIDPGLSKTGYAVLQKIGRDITIIEAGVIRTVSSDSMQIRLSTLFDGINEIFHAYRIDKVAIETVFAGKNISSALKLSHARGVLILAAGMNKLEIFEISPKEVKQSITGSGNATKEQILYMIKNLTGIKELSGPLDTYDAIAIALSLLQQNRIIR
ncbi:MAG: crossover junction endodeoxyribonuclease RuvC [Candidatus Cloacimonadota bacterium]|nr:MAG: crossover junction endodeoxyribonuclease RuvC [Candidatus Cloacimonadota bacterium]PIE78401.1 MAG: crossover junction endodeoxyribonuclease RuvC [Candidatus Delongbacteria bacterium]